MSAYTPVTDEREHHVFLRVRGNFLRKRNEANNVCMYIHHIILRSNVNSTSYVIQLIFKVI